MQLVAYGAQDLYLSGDPHDIYSFQNQNVRSPFDMNNWKHECVLILETDRNMECPIQLELIQLNDEYGRCKQCKYNFSKEALMNVFKTKSTCPMCRAKWLDKTLYTNKKKKKSKKKRKN